AIDRPYDKIVFRDLPNTMVEIEQTLEHSQISQLYLVLQHEKSIYFEGIPSKSLFKKCYKALINKKETDLIKEGMLLCEYLNIKPEILTFMLKVFKELEFIYDEKGLIKINPAPNKQDIENSRIYQMRRARMEVEERLLYDDFLNIKEWIISKLT
nr:single-stranded-DNA-specific exonuclease C-terminal domain-containing protein [Staphylococcus epidermidis]